MTKYLKVVCRKCKETHNVKVREPILNMINLQHFKTHYICFNCQFLANLNPSINLFDLILRRQKLVKMVVPCTQCNKPTTMPKKYAKIGNWELAKALCDECSDKLHEESIAEWSKS